MAQLVIRNISQSGLNPAAIHTAANGGGDQFLNDGFTALWVKNGDVASKTVTVLAQANCNHGFKHDDVVAIPAGEERMIGPFQIARFNDASNNIQITYSAVTSLTIAAVKQA